MLQYDAGHRTPILLRWPGKIAPRRDEHPVSSIDIVPTLLEATGIKAPEEVNGIKQRPIEGVSMAYTFDKTNANVASKRETPLTGRP